jgi:DNA-binding response OmpR family regulator
MTSRSTHSGPELEPTIRVLLVEGNAEDAALFREHVEPPSGAGYHVDTVPRLVEAVVALGHCRPDVIVTESTLPDAQGGDVVRRLCAAAPLIPVIVLTRASDDREALAALRSGASESTREPCSVCSSMLRNAAAVLRGSASCTTS